MKNGVQIRRASRRAVYIEIRIHKIVVGVVIPDWSCRSLEMQLMICILSNTGFLRLQRIAGSISSIVVVPGEVAVGNLLLSPPLRTLSCPPQRKLSSKHGLHHIGSQLCRVMKEGDVDRKAS